MRDILARLLESAASPTFLFSSPTSRVAPPPTQSESDDDDDDDDELI